MHMMTPRELPRRTGVRLAAGAAALALVAIACGGDSEPTAEEAVAEQAAAEEALAGAIDLGSEGVDPAYDTETNLFPDLVVDDVSRGKKVNLRNIVQDEKPLLVWMYAPH
jgi:hypothetical protein